MLGWAEAWYGHKVKYGWAGLVGFALREDFMEAIQIIRTLTGDIDGVNQPMNPLTHVTDAWISRWVCW